MQKFSALPLNALIMLFLGGIGLGFAPIFVKWANPEPNIISPAAIGFYRMLFSLPMLALFFLIPAKRQETTNVVPKKGLGIFLSALAGVFFALDLFFWHKGLEITSAANATLFANTAPIYVAIILWLFFKEKLRSFYWIGLFVSILGTVILIWEDINWKNGDISGNLLSMLAGFFYGCYLLSLAKSRQYLLAGISIFIVALAAGAFLLLLVLIQGDSLYPYPEQTWYSLLALAIIIQAAAAVIVAWALGRLPIAFSAIGLLIQPITAAILGVILLQEALDGLQAVGSIVILSGIYLAHSSFQKPKNPLK